MQKNAAEQALHAYWIGAMHGDQESKNALEELLLKEISLLNIHRQVYEHEQNWAKAKDYYQQAIKGRMLLLCTGWENYQQNRLSESNFKAPIIITQIARTALA